MKAFIASVVALIAISVIAGVVLNEVNMSAAEATKTPTGATRL